jgi:hypothetical protein
VILGWAAVVIVPARDVAVNVPIPLILVLESTTNAFDADAVPVEILFRYDAWVLLRLIPPSTNIFDPIEEMPNIDVFESATIDLDGDAVPGVIDVK